MEHIIVRIIGFNQAELFFGFLEHLFSFPQPFLSVLVHRLTLKSKSLSGENHSQIMQHKARKPEKCHSLFLHAEAAKSLWAQVEIVTIKKYNETQIVCEWNHWNKFSPSLYVLFKYEARKKFHRIKWRMENYLKTALIPSSRIVAAKFLNFSNCSAESLVSIVGLSIECFDV